MTALIFALLLPLVGLHYAVLFLGWWADEEFWLNLYAKHWRFANFLWGFGFNRIGHAPWQKREQT